MKVSEENSLFSHESSYGESVNENGESQSCANEMKSISLSAGVKMKARSASENQNGGVMAAYSSK